MSATVIPFPTANAEKASTESLANMAQLIATKQGAPVIAEYLLAQAIEILKHRNRDNARGLGGGA